MDADMHVGLNLVYLVPGETGGMETYARELISALLQERPSLRMTAFVNREATAAGNGPWLELIPSVVVPVQARSRIEWVRGEQQLLPPLARRNGIDVLHSLASTAPVWGQFARVVTIHDLIYRVYPEAHAGLRSVGMRFLVPLAARRSTRLIAPSKRTRDDLVGWLNVPPGKIDIVPEGIGTTAVSQPISEAELRTRYALGDRAVVLSVSAKRPHKNLARLLQAVAEIESADRPVLVLPGYPTAHEEELKRLATDLGLQQDVRFLGWITAAELEGWYQLASCFVFPSLYEGFGLPVLEAMSRGVPVLCSNRGSLSEVAGSAALLFEPEDAHAMADAIRKVLKRSDVRESLRRRGVSQAARFDWGKSAQLTLRTYELALAARRGLNEGSHS